LSPRPPTSFAVGALLLLTCALPLTASARATKNGAAGKAEAKGGSWYFAVSGDSRDCGDLVMPKIAWSIEHNREAAPVEFYWHLGDLRAMFRIDCDMLVRAHPDYDCRARPAAGLAPNDFNEYLKYAWDDFVERQIAPFGRTPFLLGIGNHELINRTREDFRCRFSKWLTQEPIQSQLKADAKRGVPSQAASTFYHFVRGGVDFIYLDNADADASFSDEQLDWLARVLAADAEDKKVRSIVVGMHAALPQSSERGHAMDATCRGFCTGLRAYDLLYRAQNLDAPPRSRKRVYLFASHSHFFRENVYDTPEHRGRVLPGWIVGTGGAEQYTSRETDPVRYGYLEVEVRPDGGLATRFREVTRRTPPLATGPGADALTAFCFEQNKRPPADIHQTDCKCAPTP
jgi:hypothetical protein